MSTPLPVRRPSADLFPVVPVTVVIFAIAVLGCSVLEGAFRSMGALLAMGSVVLVVLFTFALASLSRKT